MIPNGYAGTWGVYAAAAASDRACRFHSTGGMGQKNSLGIPQSVDALWSFAGTCSRMQQQQRPSQRAKGGTGIAGGACKLGSLNLIGLQRSRSVCQVCRGVHHMPCDGHHH